MKKRPVRGKKKAVETRGARVLVVGFGRVLGAVMWRVEEGEKFINAGLAVDASASAVIGFVRAEVRFEVRTVRAEKGRDFWVFVGCVGCVI